MREVDSYIINSETLLIMPYAHGKSKVYEFDDVLIVNLNTISIMKNSCLYFGSSLEGRMEGTKSLLNYEIKVPIVVEDTNNLIFFPTSSYKNSQVIWISYNNLLKYNKNDKFSTLLDFKNNVQISIDVKYNIIDNQVIRCIKLDAIIDKRKKYFLFNEK